MVEKVEVGKELLVLVGRSWRFIGALPSRDQFVCLLDRWIDTTRRMQTLSECLMVIVTRQMALIIMTNYLGTLVSSRGNTSLTQVRCWSLTIGECYTGAVGFLLPMMRVLMKVNVILWDAT